jgi:hypothetical protein
LISSTYRPPSRGVDKVSSFLVNFQESLDKATDSSSLSIIILGDFNDRCTKWNSIHSTSDLDNNLLDLSLLNNFSQLILDPTRGGNILDLIFTNTPDLFLKSGVIPSLSNLDHDSIFGTLKLSYIKSSPYTRHVWYYDRGNFESLNEIFDNTPWDDLINDHDDLDDIVTNFTTIVLESAKACIPNSIVKIRPRDKPWFNKELRKLFSERNRCHKRQKRTNNPIHINLFKEKRKEATDAYKLAKHEYYSNISETLLSSKSCEKTYWKLIKSSMGEINNSSIPDMIDDGNIISDNKQKAELLNDYFISMSRLPDATIPIPDPKYKTQARLSAVPITPQIVKETILKLDISKATGPDKISNKILKECANSFCIPLICFAALVLLKSLAISRLISFSI